MLYPAATEKYTTIDALAFVILISVSLFFSCGITGVDHADVRPIVRAATDTERKYYFFKFMMRICNTTIV